MSNKAVDQMVLNAFLSGIEEGKGKEEIKLSMINAGASIGNIHRTFMHLMKEHRLYMSPEEKRDAVENILTPLDLTDKEIYEEAIEQLSGTIPNVDDAKAERMIIRWCKKNKHPYWTDKPRRGDLRKFMSRFLAFISEEEMPDEDTVVAFIFGKNGYHPTTQVVKNHLSMFLDIYNTFASIRVTD